MMSLNLNDVTEYVEQNIGDYHERRYQRLRNLKLKSVLKRKNPYLFKAKAFYDPHDLVKSLLEAHLSSQEETFFGEFLEGLAIYICGLAYSGEKSESEGIDLRFRRDGILYIVSIKSGPNWGNNQQIQRMIANFKKAKKIILTSGHKENIAAINGCCYGQDNRPDNGDYSKVCGQAFWKLISGQPNLYINIIEPLGYRAKERNDNFQQAYAQVITKLTAEFALEFCDDGMINWQKLVEFNSKAA